MSESRIPYAAGTTGDTPLPAPIPQPAPAAQLAPGGFWARIVLAMQRNKNDGCAFAIVNLRTGEVGVVVEMERGGR